MNTPSDAMNDADHSVPVPPLVLIGQPTLLYWSIRREIWENRSVYIAPIAAAVVFLVGYLLATVSSGFHMFDVSSADGDTSQTEMITGALNTCAAMIIGVSAIVGFFYTLDALYSERRDRSILFWKSLPVSDLITIASKVAIPLVVLPAVAYVAIVVTQLIILLLGTVVLAVHGVSPVGLWSAASLVENWVVLLYMVIVLSLWYAPIVGWLLLVSAWAQRLAILWAVLLPLALCVVEYIGLHTWRLGHLMAERIGGAFGVAFNHDQMAYAPSGGAVDNPHNLRGPLHAAFGLTPDPVQFISSPALWLGLIVAVALFAGALRLRRSRDAL